VANRLGTLSVITDKQDVKLFLVIFQNKMDTVDRVSSELVAFLDLGEYPEEMRQTMVVFQSALNATREVLDQHPSRRLRT
jgi:hypothetical protein